MSKFAENVVAGLFSTVPSFAIRWAGQSQQHAEHVWPDNPFDEQPAEPPALTLGQGACLMELGENPRRHVLQPDYEAHIGQLRQLRKACRFRQNDPQERDIVLGGEHRLHMDRRLHEGFHQWH